MTEIRDRTVVAAAIGFIVLQSAVFAGCAWWAKTPELLNRGGSTIMIFVALSVVWQVAREAKAETRSRRFKETNRSDAAGRSVSAPSVTSRIFAKSHATAASEFMEVRRIYIWYVAAATAYGEFLNGWGDLVIKAVGIEHAG